MELQESGKKIFIADDDPANRLVLSRLIESLGYSAATAADGCELLARVEEEIPSLILLDMTMPCLTGVEALQRLKQGEGTRGIPVIIVTGEHSREERLEAIHLGASDFLRKPIDLDELGLRLRNVLDLSESRRIIEQRNVVLEERVQRNVQELKEKNEELLLAVRATDAGYRETIFRLTLAAEYRDENTGDHVQRISHFASEMAGLLGMDSTFCNVLHEAASMHDVGKVGIPDSILMKPSSLTPEERKIIENHTIIGATILKGSLSPYLNMAEEIALSHHERYDGTGYPYGLAGEKIPITGRIVNLVDQYDALRNERPYKRAFSHEEATRILISGDGRTLPIHFDPEVLNAFKKNHDFFNEIHSSFSQQAAR